MKAYKARFKKKLIALSKQDKDFKKLFKLHGDIEFEPEFVREPFESLVRAIAHQQIHGKAAAAILNRMLALFSAEARTATAVKSAPRGDVSVEYFPTPNEMLKLSPDDLRLCGFSGTKTRAILDIAEKSMSGLIPSSEEIVKLSSEEIISRLTQAFGVGEWTVQMLLIFQLGRLDVWPVLDFGVRNGFMLFYRKRKMPTPADLRKFGVRWKSYESIMALYFWAHANAAADATKAEKTRKKLFSDGLKKAGKPGKVAINIKR